MSTNPQRASLSTRARRGGGGRNSISAITWCFRDRTPSLTVVTQAYTLLWGPITPPAARILGHATGDLLRYLLCNQER